MGDIFLSIIPQAYAIAFCDNKGFTLSSYNQ